MQMIRFIRDTILNSHRLFLVSVLVLFSTGPAWAGGVGNNPIPAAIPTSSTASQLSVSLPQRLVSQKVTAPNVTKLLSIVTGAQQIGLGMAKNFIPYAEGLTLLLGMIMLVWLGIMIMLSQADIWHMGARPIFVEVITIGMALFFLQSYSFFVGSVVDGFTFAGNILARNQGNEFAGIGMPFNSYSGLMHGYALQFNGLPSVSVDSITWFSWLLSFLIDVLTDLGSIGIFSFINVVCYLLYVVMYLSYQFIIAIAIAIGPVFIPFLVMPLTRALFEGWMKMLIMSGIYVMTSTVIMGLLAQASVTLFSGMGSSNGGILDYAAFNNMGIMAEMSLFGVFSVLAMLQTHSFAHAIAGSVNLSGMNPVTAVAKVAK